jgi:hypothetical protein
MPISLRKTALRCVFLLTAGLTILIYPLGHIQAAQSVALAWDPASSAAGYRLYCGTTSRVYTQTIEVGTTTQTLVSNLVGGTTYFFAVTAYNTSAVESAPSNEVSYLAALATPTPTPSPTPTSLATPPLSGLSGLTVVKPSGAVVAPFTNNYVYDLAIDQAVQANPVSGVGSVVFKLDGVVIRTESVLPYAVAGDVNGLFNVWKPTVGAHTLTATPYSSTGGGGTAGVSITVAFTVK